jgi:post-segregation antitoxin (ccd killing protein)
MKVISVKVPEEIYEKMKMHKEINWSEVIRNAIISELNELEGITTGNELIERLKRLGVDEKDINVEPRQGEDEFQKELKKKSMIRTP